MESDSSTSPTQLPSAHEWRAHLEALLFIAPQPVGAAQLAQALGVSPQEVESALRALEADYLDPQKGRGLRLQRFGERWQMTTAPASAPYVERFLGLEASARLSRAALEVLAIVLYRQPITRPQIDAIRGVNSEGVLRTLLLKGLIQELGRAEFPGRPILYGVSEECLQYFGLSSLDELPPLGLDEEEATLHAVPQAPPLPEGIEPPGDRLKKAEGK